MTMKKLIEKIEDETLKGELLKSYGLELEANNKNKELVADLSLILGAGDGDNLKDLINNKILSSTKAEQEAQQELLKVKGDKEALERYQAQIKEDAAKEKAAFEQRTNDMILSRDKKDFINGISNSFTDEMRPFAVSRLESMLESNFDSGKSSFTIKNGNDVIANNANDFIEYAKNEGSWKQVIKCDSNGGGIVNNGSSANLNKDIVNKYGLAD